MIRRLAANGEITMLLAQEGRERLSVGRLRSKYQPPRQVERISLDELLLQSSAWKGHHQQAFDLSRKQSRRDRIYYAGDLSLLSKPCVSVVGTRKVSREGAARTRRLARGLVEAGIVVMAGLAFGVDTEALTAALEAGGKVVAVIGTPLDQASPVANADIQEEIYGNHLLISQFEPGSKVWPSNFPLRNKLMAALSLGTVIIEASDTSGTLHQAAECTKLGHWLFIAQSVINDASVTWPEKFQKYPTCIPLTDVSDITSRIHP